MAVFLALVSVDIAEGLPHAEAAVVEGVEELPAVYVEDAAIAFVGFAEEPETAFASFGSAVTLEWRLLPILQRRYVKLPAICLDSGAFASVSAAGVL